MPKLICDDFFHPILPAFLGVFVPVKSIEVVRSRVSFQDWNVGIVFFSSHKKGLGWVRNSRSERRQCWGIEMDTDKQHKYLESDRSRELKIGQEQDHEAR